MDYSKFVVEAVSKVQERGRDYGSFHEGFQKASVIATTMLNKEISSYDIMVVMMAVKMSRIAFDMAHQDSWVDLIAYTSFAGELGTNGTTRQDNISSNAGTS
jgi:Domain of unknown function (DUF6378)